MNHESTASETYSQREQEALERASYFKAIMHTAVDPIIVITDKGIIEHFNPSAEKVFGYTQQEAIGQNVSSLMPSEHAEKHDAYIEKYLTSGQAKIIGIGREVTGLRKDGSTFPMNLAVSEIKNTNGESHFAGVVRDLSKEKAMEAEIARAYKLEAVGQLAAGIAHEINTPTQFVGDNIHFLGGAFNDLHDLIKLYGELIPKYEAGEHPAELVEQIKQKTEQIDFDYLVQDIPDSLDQSSDGVDRISEIVKAMKEFSHPGSDNKQPMDLNKAILNTVTVARSEWKYVCEVSTDLDPKLPMVECSGAEINQAILNIVVNAAHAIQDRKEKEGDAYQGKITLKTRQENGYALIEISDTGCGISQENLNRIFEPFYTTKEVGKGTGQGLAIVHSVIVDDHQGKLLVNSVVGLGTTFLIKLPITAPGTQDN